MASQQLKHLQSSVQSLRSSLQSPAQHKTIPAQLIKLKIALTQAGALIPGNVGVSGHTDTHIKELWIVARTTLEIQAFYSLRTRAIAQFEKSIDQLGPFYNDSKLGAILPPSASHAPLTSLHLLLLLSQNRISTFHTVLETLSGAEGSILSNPYLEWVISLERHLAMGVLAKAHRQALKEIPTPTPSTSGLAKKEDFTLLVEDFVEGIRAEVQSCISKAYPPSTLTLSDVKTLLFFGGKKGDAEIMEFGRKNAWIISPLTPHYITFPLSSATSTSDAMPVDGSPDLTFGKDESGLEKEFVVEGVLGYARELESIV